MRPTTSSISRYACRDNVFRNLRFVALCANVQCAVILVLSALALRPCFAQTAQEKKQALNVLERYVHTRLQDESWKTYSQFITWPDEPSWDCYWVVKTHSIGTATYGANAATIPVTYKRLGLSCDNFDFEAKEQTVTIKYDLVKSSQGWKVNGPIPDYPDIDATVLLKELKEITTNPKEMSSRQVHASTEARMISAALGEGN
jgi:hypothetical protein